MMENKKVINGSLVVLFLSLAIVYSLVYQKKESLFKSPLVNGNEVASQIGIQNQNGGSETRNSVKSSSGNENTEEIKSSENINGTIGSNTQDPIVDEPPILIHVVSSDDEILRGTTEYFGTLDIVNILGQKPEFTLQDSKGNYFAYYGKYLDFIQTVETLGGNVYEMKTEAEILQNHLFGDKVSYINLSVFKDIWVIMVIEIDDEIRLLQIPANKYHYSKDYLKSLFID